MFFECPSRSWICLIMPFPCILAGNTNSFSSGGSDAWLIKVVSTGTQKVSPTEKIAGFEIVLVIAIILTVYLAGRKRG